MPSPENAAVIERNAQLLVDFSSNPDATVDDFRQVYEDFCSELEVPADGSFETVEIGGVECVWATSPGASADRTIVHFHSGGYVIGSADGYRGFGARLSAASGARVLLVHYRRAPEAPFPAAADDGVAVLRALVADGTPASSIVVCGDSAGGGMCLIVLQQLRDAGDELPAAGVAISPWADLALTSPSLAENAANDPLVAEALLAQLRDMYVGETGADTRDPKMSPVYGDFTGLPPLLLMSGSIETLRDDAKRAAEKAQAEGVDATYVSGEGMVHIWPVFADRLPEAQATIEQIGAFASEKLQAGAPI